MKRKLIIDPDEIYLNQPVKDKKPSIDFKILERHWYERLLDSGFDDLENTARADRPLKSWHNLRFKTTDTTTRTNAEEYSHDAKELLNTYKFKSDLHRRIWELHCKGMSIYKIEVAIAHLEKTYKREQIRKTICSIAQEIKL